MQKFKIAFKRAVLFLFICVAVDPAVAQSQNEKAQKWFEAGHLERNVNKKIHSYKMATKEDSLFADAYYYLGMMHKSKKNYFQAGDAFQRAFRIAQSETDRKKQYKIAGEMAEVFDKLKNFKEYEKALRACIQYAPTDPKKQKHSIILSRFFYKRNRKSEAVEILKGIQEKLSASSSNTFLSQIQMVELGEKAEKAIADGDLLLAKALLDSLKASPSIQKNIAVKIVELDSLLRLKEIEMANKNSYSLAIKLASEGNLDHAILLLEKIIRNSENYRDTKILLKQLNQTREKQKKEKKQIPANPESTKVENEHNEKKSEWKSQVLTGEIAPLPDETNKKATQLEKTRHGLSQTPVNRSKVDSIISNDSRNYIQKQTRPYELFLNSLDSTPEIVLDSLEISIEGITASEQRDEYDSSRVLENRSDLSFLRASKDNAIDSEKQTKAANFTQSNSRIPLYFSLSIMAILILFISFLHFISPPNLARILIFFNKYDYAIKYLERGLHKAPNKLEIYTFLANLYLQTGKRDQMAMYVFKKVLNRDSKDEHFNEIIRIVKDDYTMHGAMDSNFEKLLKQYS